ncbi:MAG: hypothetical protein IV086_11010 [Hyphomonadaceae bacterium]|nr:MAG: hypothetical protein FD160_1310 [Caulobacteraceae bacterium]MBT9446219.1 hypothetical protein [Hyphomonadaceae bacterium]TPW07197.1 MAG: hypothetical protein FD124_1342 [Alphaproteobacteria bacterium]
MRLITLAAALSFAFAASAAADPVVVRPLAIDAELQKKFEEEYGTREIAELSEAVSQSLASELRQAGGSVADAGPITIETTLVDVKPSKPTLEQLRDKPGLDYFRSVSLGGAELRARLLAADGSVLREVSYDWYETDLLNTLALGTWSDARRAVRRFADKVGDAYHAQAKG